MSWEDIAQELADGWDMTFQEAMTIVSFVARKLRAGNSFAQRYDNAAGTWKRRRY